MFKVALGFIKHLFVLKAQVTGRWNEAEVKGLVDNLRCRGFEKSWPTTKSTEFWESAATFIASCIQDHSVRSGKKSGCGSCIDNNCDYFHIGSACRNKVFNTLRKRFKSPEIAETYYFPKEVVASSDGTAGNEMNVTCELRNQSESLPLQQLGFISDLYKSFVTSNSSVNVPDDFLRLCSGAFEIMWSF